MSGNTSSLTRITIPARLSFPQLFKPRAIDDKSTPKYSASLIIPKTDTATIQRVKQAMKAAYEAGKHKFGAKAPALEHIKLALQDGDTNRPNDPAYANAYYINANNTNRPRVVDENVDTVTDPDYVYAGCYVNAAISFFVYASAASKGISAALEAIQKTGDGERLAGGTPDIRQLFSPVPKTSTGDGWGTPPSDDLDIF